MSSPAPAALKCPAAGWPLRLATALRAEPAPTPLRTASSTALPGLAW